MKCLNCGQEAEGLVRSLCKRCYSRDYDARHPGRKKRRIMTEKCTVCNEAFAIARGLCDKHYKRWLRHGHTEQTRPDTWGEIEKHPLLSQWRWLNERISNISDEWFGNFRAFVADVGERPSKNHFLRQLDPEKPYGPGNFAWVEKKIVIRNSESIKEYRRRYAVEHRKTNYRGIKNSALKKTYGITIDEYEEILEKQDGRCAICGEREAAKFRGKVQSLSVDHCHRTGKIRGLLCSYCNRAIGGMKENPDLLRKAAEYLEKHQPNNLI